MIKTLIAIAGFLFAVNASAVATYEITGEQARTMMETLAAADFAVTNIDEEWSKVGMLQINTGPVVCRYSVQFPDEWMSNVTCRKGDDSTPVTDYLPNALSLAQQIRQFAFWDAGLGSRWLQVQNIACSLEYNTRAYNRVITADENED